MRPVNWPDGFMKWAKRVEERSKGGLKIEVFHSAQLGHAAADLRARRCAVLARPYLW